MPNDPRQKARAAKRRNVQRCARKRRQLLTNKQCDALQAEVEPRLSPTVDAAIDDFGELAMGSLIDSGAIEKMFQNSGGQ